MKLTNEQRARLELALMGYVVSCDEDAVDLKEATRYILSAVNGKYKLSDEEMDAKAEEAVKRIHEYDTEESANKVRFISVNTAPILDNDVQITYIIDTGDEYSPCGFIDPKRLCRDKSRKAGEAYYWFSFVFNVGVTEFSEFGDTFYRMITSKGKVHRVS